jgi:hypothetical protein
MTKQTFNSSSEIRTLDNAELDMVTGGVIDGCIKLPGILTINPLPPSSPPWFDATWTQIGQTGTLPR